MKTLLSLLLVLLLLTGCAAQPPVEPESQSTDTVPETAVVESPSVTEESVPKENATEESIPAEEISGPENSDLTDTETEEISLEGFDALVRLQQYDWYGAPEADGPGVDFGTVPLTADQQAELEILLHIDQWEPAEDLPPVGVTVVMSLENSTTGERLSICPWDGATLVIRDRYFPNGHKGQTFYFAPIWLSDDAQRYMFDAAYASWPNPQTMKDLSPLCRYPNTLSAAFTAHLATVEDVCAITLADPFHADYARIYMPLYYATMSTPWESAEEIPADNLLTAFRSLHFNQYALTEEFLIDADLADPILQQYFDVDSAHLRSAACFIRDAGCYRMGGADGLGGPIFGPTLLQRMGDNHYRLYLEFGEAARDGRGYYAFEFELTDTGYRYLRSDGMLSYEEHPLPTA